MSAINVTQVSVLVRHRSRSRVAFVPRASSPRASSRGRLLAVLARRSNLEDRVLRSPLLTVVPPPRPPRRARVRPSSQDNPAFFLAPLKFEIQYECLQPLQKDLEWKLTYVGSAESDAHDQELDVVLVGPVAVGSYKFVFQADPPDHNKIPASDLLGVTVLLLTCAYDGVEFIRRVLIHSHWSPYDPIRAVNAVP